jgi:hypothetical protein
MLRYEALACEQIAAVEHVAAALVTGLRPLADVQLPSFADLQQADDRPR